MTFASTPFALARASATLARARESVGARAAGRAGTRRVATDARAWANARARASARVRTNATEGGESWEDLFDAFERQASEAEAEREIPRAKTRALERALARGRRKVEVRELCKELELERHEVIRWLKRNGHRAEELGRRYAEELANEDAEREARERAREARAERAEAERQAAAEAKSRRGNGPGGMPAYKTYKKTRLGSSNISTLEKVYAVTQYPDDAMVESIRQATRLPASKIIAWFKERRSGASAAAKRSAGVEDRSRRRSSGAAYSYTRRNDGGGLRRGGADDAYGDSNGPRRGRDAASDWSAYD